MSFDSIMGKIFGTAPSTPAAPQNPGVQNPNNPSGVQNPGTPLPGTQGGTPGTAPNGIVPAQEPTNKEPTPFADFTDLWKTDPNAVEPPDQSLFANLDPAKVMESARKVNFSGAITQDQMAKIAAGGQDAIAAFTAAMNSVAQTVYAQSAVATAKIVEQAVTRQQEKFESTLPATLRRFSTSENLAGQNPLLSNPAVQPIVGALQEQLIRKNPNATSAEISQQVNDYLAQLGTAFAPKPPESPSGSGRNLRKPQEENWDSFLS